MDAATYLSMLESEDGFHLRRAVERMREGLFDPLAVRLLTAHEERLNRTVDAGFKAVGQGKSPHLAIVGAYGQGKSHSLAYIQDRALRAGFVTSLVNLDPREMPFHDLAQVYRTLLAEVRFPDGDGSLLARWRDWAEAEVKRRGEALPNGAIDLVPEEMPPLFRAVLAAMAQKTVGPPEGKRGKKQPPPHPRTVAALLARALTGTVVPATPLKQALLARGVVVPASMAMRGPDPWLSAIRGFGRLFQQLGYRGWVVLFDEGESIAMLSLRSRSRAYQLLHRFFFPEQPTGLYPIFAFTDDFLEKVRTEDYDRVSIRGGEEIPVFERNYAEAWEKLEMFRLQDLSRQEWDELTVKLMHLHARAYRWHPAEGNVRQALGGRLAELPSLETRSKLKALVDQLDLAQQEVA